MIRQANIANIAPVLDANPALISVMRRLEDAGHEAHLVGGAVRNALLERPIKDYDIATSAHPEIVCSLFEAAGRRVVPTGIEHGTVSVIEDDQTFEITTWRRDVATDGRRATIAYATSLHQDARRRDFTINALYASADGTVIDPTGEGLDDIHERRVRFIDDPATRIHEDALRILRFFRFSGSIGTLDRDSRDFAACAALAPVMTQLSRERVGQEMRQILAQPKASAMVDAMNAAGVLKKALPGYPVPHALTITHLRRLERLEADLQVSPSFLRRLALLSDETAREALVLTKVEYRAFSRMQAQMDTIASEAEMGFLHGLDLGTDIALLRAALSNTPSGYLPLEDVALGATSPMPVGAVDLPDHLHGKIIGEALKRAEKVWVQSRFTADKATILSQALS